MSRYVGFEQLQSTRRKRRGRDSNPRQRLRPLTRFSRPPQSTSSATSPQPLAEDRRVMLDESPTRPATPHGPASVNSEDRLRVTDGAPRRSRSAADRNRGRASPRSPRGGGSAARRRAQIG